MILAGVLVTSLFFVRDYPKIIPILFLTVGFGVIGFLDDYLKVVLRRSDGLLAWQKMLLQIVKKVCSKTIHLWQRIHQFSDAGKYLWYDEYDTDQDQTEHQDIGQDRGQDAAHLFLFYF